MATAGGGGGGGGGGINGPSSATITPLSGRPNVSVTSINCDGHNNSSSIGAAGTNQCGVANNHPNNMSTSSSVITSTASAICNASPPLINGTSHYYGNGSGSGGGGIRISVPKMEQSDDESDTELSHIEHTAAIVNMRTTHRTNSSTDATVPRPMSWEGELSETEDGMDTEHMTPAAATTATSNHNCRDPPNIGPAAYVNSSQTASMGQQQQQLQPNTDTKYQMLTTSMQPLLLNKDTIKPEYEMLSSDSMGGGQQLLYSGGGKKLPPELVNLKFEPGVHDAATSQANSPLLARSKTATLLPANPSPDSAIHSHYTHSSPSESPLTSRHAPYTPSLSRNNSDASHSSCYSYSSEFSPTHSPIQGRHHMYPSGGSNFNGSPLHHSVLYRPMMDGSGVSGGGGCVGGQGQGGGGGGNCSSGGGETSLQRGGAMHQQHEDNILESETLPSAGISRQQLINSPCPICGDKISGFHYGIFSCESCKGFFKRTVQNRKNYVCLRGAACPVTIATRKKCPACRFEKCLQRGMKLEAIREDRTRGGRSTYQCSYTLPNSMLSPPLSADGTSSFPAGYRGGPIFKMENGVGGSGPIFKMENSSDGSSSGSQAAAAAATRQSIPTLLQEIMDVEHLWQYNESELTRLNQTPPASMAGSNPATNPLLASAGLANGENSNPDLIANLCNVADHRLYKIVKWCKSLPLFKHISIDDQICLLINSWCELLLFSCCFRSISTPGEVRISLGKSINLVQAKSNGLQACIERMLNLTDHLRRLRVDRYEYVAMKVIVLLQSDTSELRETEKVRASQEKALQALQAYTLAHYPEAPAKFGELLLRIPELQRTCQVGKEMLTIKSKDGEDFNLLMELLRGEH